MQKGIKFRIYPNREQKNFIHQTLRCCRFIYNRGDVYKRQAWNCLAEIEDGELIDVFCDVVIRNTTDKFDHFYDNVEMDLLKALCLYVFEEYPHCLLYTSRCV